MKTILNSRRQHHTVRVSIFFLIIVALIAGMVGCGGVSVPATEIRTWYDLDAVRDRLSGSYILMNDLSSGTAGYEELAGPNANGGAGWEPLGKFSPGTLPFSGSFDGQGYEIRDLFIDRPDEDDLGLFGTLSMAVGTPVVQNVGGVNFTVVGMEWVGGLVGAVRFGTVSNCYCTGDITGTECVGGLVGSNYGIVRTSNAAGSVTGELHVGGLLGANGGLVADCHYSGSVTGGNQTGGLVGTSGGNVSNSYSSGIVTGHSSVGGLVGWNGPNVTVSNSHSSASVSGNEHVGGLAGANGGSVSNCYSTGSVTGSRQVGGLVGTHEGGTINSCYSTGNVAGEGSWLGGLVGANHHETEPNIVSNSFWDIQTSGRLLSDGGTGKNTTEMQAIATFTDVDTEGLDKPWDIVAVASDVTNSAYMWNIVDGETYPFLSWQPVS